MRRTVSILGSTGSIGVNTLDVIAGLNRRGASIRLGALTGHTNLDLLKKQMRRYRPQRVVTGEGESAAHLSRWLRRWGGRTQVDYGPEGLLRAAIFPGHDLVVSAVVGAVGLEPLMAALRRGTDVALANKEALIMAGPLVMNTARRQKARLIPVDSEHSAMFQCLGSRTGKQPGVRRIILTASGGAFYRHRGSLSKVRVEQALAHPTWKMGPKITVDCATLTNKGLEAIEAHHLFGVPLDKIKIVIHPQSIVHSLVEFEDGSMLAQLSHPDMRLPIQYALTYPERAPSPVRPLELEEIQNLEFYSPNFARFPSLALALDAGRRGGFWPAVFNAANEEAVGAFLQRRIKFTDIFKVCRKTLSDFQKTSIPAQITLAKLMEVDRWGRDRARKMMKTINGDQTWLG